MLMKMNTLVSVFHVLRYWFRFFMFYDVVNGAGVTAHISHMDTGAVFNEEDGKVCQGRHEGGSKQIRNLWNKA
ncbi:putative malate dehydrogenase [Helianthus annuus]|nr:putative malate dehydrogenase [Helianthus annuus]KAJ0636446.1 putative malate dehydrogenase [Helianthus annuus]KAJ0818323.1 putative malate dehydrogenase [Helianthus annuus]